jgi:ubiquinone/menaquinone biosynthesis C-methylase UbiE
MEDKMAKKRIPETDSGIQGEFNVTIFDEFQRGMRDRGWIETPAILKAGIDSGMALEIGPGPGYVGLEWLKQTHGTRLKALEISADMIRIGEKNAAQYGLETRWEIMQGSGEQIPVESAAFDAVFSCGSLHEWRRPIQTFQEIARVLKPGGSFFVADLRRDLRLPLRWLMMFICKPKAIRPGLVTSLNAAYTRPEILKFLEDAMIDKRPDLQFKRQATDHDIGYLSYGH